MQLAIIFILGLIVGSFLNVVIFRLRSGDSFISGRSHCLACKKELAAKDLIPFFSFIYLRGRCRYCKAKISWQYPVVEILTGAVFILFALNHGSRITDYGFLIQLILASVLIVIAVFDLKHYLILDKVVFPALALSMLFNIYSHHFLSGLLAGAITAGFFGLQYLISRGRWIGLGDVKLGLLLGSIALWPQIIILLLLAYFSGAIVGVGLILAGKKQLGGRLPFGVFLASSGIIVMLWGNQITSWYLSLIGIR